MTSISPCSLQKYLKIFPGKHSDYEHLYRFHYLSAALGPSRAVYKLVDDHPWRRLAAPVVGVIVYGVPSANLAARNAATGGLFAGLDRSAAVSRVGTCQPAGGRDDAADRCGDGRGGQRDGPDTPVL